MPIAIVIHERAARAKPWLLVPEPSRFGHIRESSVAIVAVKRVLAEIGAKNIVKAVVVVVADANSACPPNRPQARFIRRIRKCSVSIILVQAVRCALRRASEPSPRQNEQIHPPVIVVINERAAASGRFK